MTNAARRDPRVVAITGACTDLGVETLRRLSDDPRIERLIALDVCAPDVISDKMQFVNLDLSRPSAGAQLTEIFEQEQPDTIIHAAFLSAPTHDSAWAHELEDVGTMHLLDACARHCPTRFLLFSSTLVYGAAPNRPTYLQEDDTLTQMTCSRFVRDRVRAEQQVERFARSHSDVAVCSLRFAKLLGPNSDNLFTRVLSRPAVPTLAGFDPLMQCVHEEDALRAILLAIDQSAHGAFNIVGKDVLPYTTLLALLGRLPVPMPKTLAKWVGKAMWITGLSEVPSTMIEHLQYGCVADESKARARLGFVAKYDIRQTLAEFLGMPLEHGASGRDTGFRSHPSRSGAHSRAAWMN